MATFRATMPELLETRLRRVYINNYGRTPSQWEKIANIESSTQAHEDTIRVAGLGLLVLKPEGTPVSYDDPVQGTRKRVVHQTYALGFRVTMEMMDDEQYNVIEKMPADLGDATREHKEILFWSMFNDAFAGATFSEVDPGGSAIPLCGTHTFLRSGTAGSTFANFLSPTVALGVSGIESALTKFQLTPNESGRYIQIRPEWLVVHNNEAHKAYQLLETEKEPYTNENQVSTVRSSRTGLKPLETPYLTDTDSWFLVSPKSQHQIKWYNRMKVAFSRDKDAQTKDALFDAMYRASVTWDDWRGVVGSGA
jgi:hypothetical protein